MIEVQKSSANSKLKDKLNKRDQDHALRSLKYANGLIDFASNDYLGFAKSIELSQLISKNKTSPIGSLLHGSTGSRLLTGNTKHVEDVEQYIASYHNAEAALIYNSGYNANVGLFSCIADRGDTILYDELSHASIIDGVRLSYANSYKFKHNDVLHLTNLLEKATGTIYVVIESIYSMDGDSSPLNEIAHVCKQFNANLIVDEAHATGMFGEKGEGRVCELKVEDLVFARVITFGKALGLHGAVIVGSKVLRQYLINFSRSFIYTTALPPTSIGDIKCAYELLSKSSKLIEQNRLLISFFKEQVKLISGLEYINSNSCIQAIIVEGNENVKRMATEIQTMGFDVRPILSPTVIKGRERLRICIHAFNTESQIKGLIKVISDFKIS